VPAVRDGLGVDIDQTTTATQLAANWDPATDPESGITGYWCAIGTSPGGVDVLNWTNNGASTQITRTGLTLLGGRTYYVSVSAVNGAGLRGAPISSDGVTVTAAPPPVNQTIRIDCALGADIAPLIQSAAQQLATTGGTIILPEGEFLFGQQVNMNGGISLIGAGSDRTLLCSQVYGMIDINHMGNKGGSLRISGIAFLGYTRPSVGYTHQGVSLANIVDFRIDHCYFEGFAYTVNISGRAGYPAPRGVVDHCTIKRGRGTFSSMYGVTAGSWEWVGTDRLTNLGTREAVFTEDCYIEGCSHCTDAFGGGCYVLRRSTIVDCGSVGGHGPGFESTGRGTRCTEIYDNLIMKSDTAEEGLRWIGIGVRGGGGVVFNNTIQYCRYAIQFTVDSGALTLIDADQDGLWDYPSLDQTHDKWIWNNTLVRTSVLIMHYGVAAQTLILENRDYFLRAPSLELDGFEYRPFVYPHPLTVEGPLADSQP
jgi:hypothetical protein